MGLAIIENFETYEQACRYKRKQTEVGYERLVILHEEWQSKERPYTVCID